jgi:DNA-directed RNA polymerase specialized sigma24 family protein
MSSIHNVESRCPFDILLVKELKKERDKVIANCLECLSMRQKTIVNHSLQGKSNKEIMELMGLTASQFNSSKTRAVKKIKAFLLSSTS